MPLRYVLASQVDKGSVMVVSCNCQVGTICHLETEPERSNKGRLACGQVGGIFSSLITDTGWPSSLCGCQAVVCNRKASKPASGTPTVFGGTPSYMMK